MPDPLMRVRKATRARTQAEAAYRAAILEAVAAGKPVAAIAAECGTTRQNIYKLVGPAPLRPTRGTSEPVASVPRCEP